MSGNHTEVPSPGDAAPIPPEKQSTAPQSTRRVRAARLRKWASEHKWEIFWGLFFAWVMARFVFPPVHTPYWVRVIQYSGVDDATARQLRALERKWNAHPPTLGDVPVQLEVTDADDAALDGKAQGYTHDAETLLVIGHLPTSLTKRSLLTFMRANPPVPYIATNASADNLCESCTDPAHLPWLQPSPSNSNEAHSMLTFARQQGKSRCVVVTDQSSPAEGYSDELSKDIISAAHFYDVSIVNTYKMGTGTLPSEEELQKLNPDCVLYAGNADIALTLWRLLSSRNQWLLVSDGVVETNNLGQLTALPTDSVFFAYATNAADAAKSVYASDAVGIAQTLVDDLNSRGGNLIYQLRALLHFESIHSARFNLARVMNDNSTNRAWYKCSSSWDRVCIFDRNRRTNGLFHVWQRDELNHANGALAMKDIDGWHPPMQGSVAPPVHLVDSANAH